MLSLGYIKELVLRVVVVAFVVTGSSGILATTFASTARADDQCASTFFGLPAWYRGLTSDDGQCNIISPRELDDSDSDTSGSGLTSFVWTIVLNIIQALLMIVGYMSAIFLIIGGFRYITAAGSADQIKSAKDTIRNAIVGMVIALSSVAIVNVIVQAILS